ncbi:RNA-directed DNA polymerase, eukaryota, reverse transcriptase zinc-binding domain protein, partial [Tanacetum coccineum]
EDSNDLMNNKLGEEAIKTGDLNARYEDISVANKTDDYDSMDLSSEEYVLMNDKECLDDVSQVDKLNDKECLDDVTQVDKLNEISSENIEETRLNENEADRFKTSPIKSYAHVAMNSETSLNNQLRSIPTVLNDSGEEVVVFDEEMVKIVAAKSPWMVNGKPLVVYKWDPSIGLDKVEPKVLPVWVKLHNMPMEAWTNVGMSAIASCLRKPKIMDSMTTCVCRSGITKFVRVLVEIVSLNFIQVEQECYRSY